MKSIIQVNLYVSVILLLLGAAGFFASGMVSWTALIPALLGALMLSCALLSLLKPAAEMHAMHLSVVFALLGFFGSMQGFPAVYSLLIGETVGRPAAAVAKATMALLCIFYLLKSVLWFIENRRAKKQGKTA